MVNMVKGKKRPRTASTPPELPQDVLFFSILTRLPVKTLLRFRLVCKMWCSTIDDPTFVSAHFRLCPNNVVKNRVLALERFGRRNLGDTDRDRVSIRSCDTLRIRGLVFDTYEGHSNLGNLLGSCKGLFLVQPSDSPDNIQIWNPSIRKFSLPIPSCPLLPATSVKYFLGFRSNYVVLALAAHKDSVAIYNVTDKKWKLNTHKFQCDDNLVQPLYKVFANIKGGNECVWVNGIFYCIAKIPPSESRLICLDFDGEKVDAFSLPRRVRDLQINVYKFMFEVWGLMGLLCIDTNHNCLYLFEEDERWKELFSGETSGVGYAYILDHPNVSTKCLYVEGDAITMLYANISYNIKTDEIKQLNRSLTISMLDPYLEGLALRFESESLHSSGLLMQ